MIRSTPYTVPTIPRPAGDGWRAIRSVTTGGARSFWYRRDPQDRSEWVTYDRIARYWVRIVEGRTPQDAIREPYTAKDGPA